MQRRFARYVPARATPISDSILFLSHGSRSLIEQTLLSKRKQPKSCALFSRLWYPIVWQMPSTPSLQFECPNCAAKFEVVRVEAPPAPNTDREITCLSCGAPLHGREGPFLLKYFLRSNRRARKH